LKIEVKASIGEARDHGSIGQLQLLSWWWRQQISLKCGHLTTKLHSIISQIIIFFNSSVQMIKISINIVARMWQLYKTGIGLTTGFIRSHTITVYTLYDSQQLSLFSSSEDYGSNSATTAATNSYGIPCHYSLTGAAPLSNTNSFLTAGLSFKTYYLIHYFGCNLFNLLYM
jgi:hypothetical protein